MENIEKHDFNLQLTSASFEKQEFFRKFLVSQKIEAKRFYNTSFEILNIHDSTLNGIQWIDCEIKTSEITQTYFNFNYFKNCNFINTTFHETQFLNCIFDHCNFNQDLSNIVFKNCTFMNMRAAKMDSSCLVVSAQQSEPVNEVKEEAKQPITSPPIIENKNARFDVLEV